MKRTRGSLIFAVVLFLVLIILLIATFGYAPKARMFPLIFIGIGIILLAIQVLKEVFAPKGEKKATEIKTNDFIRKHLGLGIWMVTALVMFWLLGFLGTALLLPFIYLRYHRESWLLSISIPLGSCLFFYALFSLALKIPLYKGLLLPAIFG